jgi:flagellar hook-associated protein 3 FlgL
MAQDSLGDMAQTFSLRKQNLALKAFVQRMSSEMTSGQVSDPAMAVRGDFRPLIAIDASLRRIEGFRAATTETAGFTAAMQSALADVQDMTSQLIPALLTASNSAQSAHVNGVGIDAAQKFRSAVALFGTRMGDRAIFAGVETTGAALADADTILSALDTAVSGLTAAADVEAAVTTWFEDPLGYATQAYLGGVPLAPVSVAPGETADISVTAADATIRDTLKGLALAALLDRNVLSGDTTGRAALAKLSATTLMETATARSDVAARIGSAEERIAEATSRNSVELLALKIARSGILGVDPYEATSALTDAQTKLEALYSVTARMARFSLVDFLR